MPTGYMTYVSTRGEDSGAFYSDIVLKGLAADGGLYVPREYPKLTPSKIWGWKELSYHELAFKIMKRFATDIDPYRLEVLLERTYRPDRFCNGRAGEDFSQITPVRFIDDGNIGVLELSNGPTLAFKDIAMQYLGALFEMLLTDQGKELNILGATSGDTGSAAEYALRGRKGVRVFMLSPKGRMSAFQRAQMYSLNDPNIYNIAVRGSFDDAQDIVKACSSDAGFKAMYNIGTVNSINWARISAQVVYYFKAWLAVSQSPVDEVDFAVPSGNFGNVLAGWIAKQMGLPVGRLVVATNENDVLHEFFTTGVYRVRELWTMVALNGGFELNEGERRKVAESGFVSARSTHQDRLKTIAELWQKERFMVDPHTADGIKAARECRRPGVQMVVLETALPAKFADTIREATGSGPEIPVTYADIETRPQKVTELDADAAAVKRFISEAIKA